MRYQVAATGEVTAFVWDDFTDPKDLAAWVWDHDGEAKYIPARMVGTIHEQPARVEIGTGKSFAHVHQGQVVVISRRITQREQQATCVAGGTIPETFIRVNFYVVDDLTQVRPSDLDWTIEEAA